MPREICDNSRESTTVLKCSLLRSFNCVQNNKVIEVIEVIDFIEVIEVRTVGLLGGFSSDLRTAVCQAPQSRSFDGDLTAGKDPRYALY